jgi:hypothetical protein
MTLQSPDNLDTLLSEHLSSTLDGQRGRALAAFRQQQAESGRAAVMVRGEDRVIPRRALWYWAGVPSALAACLAVAVTLHFTGKPPVTTPKPDEGGSNAGTVVAKAPDEQKKPLQFEKLDQYELSREFNDGVAVINGNTPVRVIRQQTVNHMEWVDPTDKAKYSITTPVEKVGYERIQPN